MCDLKKKIVNPTIRGARIKNDFSFQIEVNCHYRELDVMFLMACL